MEKAFRVFILVGVLLIGAVYGNIVGCGGSGGGTTTTITLAVKDANGNTIDVSGDSLALNSYLVLTFSAALAAAPTTGEITLICNGTPVVPTISAVTDTDSIASNEYKVAPGSLASYAALSCVLSLEYASIADASGNKLGSAYATYTFTVAAAVAPTVESFIDASSAAVATTGTTGVNPTSFALTFTTPMDVTTVTHDNITMVCGPGNDPVDLIFESEIVAATDTDGISNNEFTIPPPTPYAFQLMSCTITLGTGLKNSDGVAITQATYTFTNDCAVSDHFINADTINFTTPTDGCWTIMQLGGELPAQAGDFVFLEDSTMVELGILEVTAENSWFATNSPMIYKTIADGDTAWTLTSTLDDYAGATIGTQSNYSIFVGNGVAFMLEFAVVPNTSSCLLQSMANGVPTAIAESLECTGFDYLTIKLERNGDVLTASYKKDATAYVEVGEYTDDGSLGETTLAVGMQFGSDVNGFVSDIESFMLDGVTVEGQY